MKQYSILNSEKIRRIEETMKIFLANNGNISDEQIAQLLAISNITSSSSTVGRDLTINIKKLFYQLNNFEDLTNEQIETINFINEKRKENLKLAKIKGGKVSSFNNDYQKDANNDKFQGCKSRYF